MKKTALALQFIGQPGQHLSGIPARDLTPDEVRVLSDQQRERCLASRLYKEVKPGIPAQSIKEGETNE